MRKIILPRGEGKTQKLIELSAKTHAYIIVKDHTRVYSIANRAKTQKLDIPMPLTFDEFIERQYYSRGIRAFLFDDADAFIQYMAGSVRVLAITINIDSNEQEEKIEKIDARPIKRNGPRDN